MSKYPKQWKQGIIQAIMARVAGWRCEVCGADIDPATNRTIGRKPMRNGLQPVIAIHHLDGDKTNCDWLNLLYCCQVCHLHVQSLWKPGDMLPLAWPKPPVWMLARKLSYRLNPQKSMFD